MKQTKNTKDTEQIDQEHAAVSGNTESERQQKEYRCTQCTKVFPNPFHQKRHIAGHMKQMKQQMKQTEGTRDSEQHDQKHEATSNASSEEKPIRHHCVECNKTFDKLHHVKRHMLTHTKQSDGAQNLKQADQEHEAPLSVDSEKKPKDYNCTECNKVVHSVNQLKRHMETHKVEIKKSECAENVVQPDQKHAATTTISYNKLRDNHCFKCTKTFHSAYHLKRHMETHLKKEPCHCVHCGKLYASRIHLRLHEVSHTGARRFACQACGCAYMSSGQLRNHEKKCKEFIDMDPKIKIISVCPYCKKDCKSRAGLTSHLSLRHADKMAEQPDGITNVKQCFACQLYYASHEFLQKHMKKCEKHKSTKSRTKKNQKKNEKNENKAATVNEGSCKALNLSAKTDGLAKEKREQVTACADSDSSPGKSNVKSGYEECTFQVVGKQEMNVVKVENGKQENSQVTEILLGKSEHRKSGTASVETRAEVRLGATSQITTAQKNDDSVKPKKLTASKSGSTENIKSAKANVINKSLGNFNPGQTCNKSLSCNKTLSTNINAVVNGSKKQLLVSDNTKCRYSGTEVGNKAAVKIPDAGLCKVDGDKDKTVLRQNDMVTNKLGKQSRAVTEDVEMKLEEINSKIETRDVTEKISEYSNATSKLSSTTGDGQHQLTSDSKVVTESSGVECKATNGSGSTVIDKFAVDHVKESTEMSIQCSTNADALQGQYKNPPACVEHPVEQMREKNIQELQLKHTVAVKTTVNVDVPHGTTAKLASKKILATATTDLSSVEAVMPVTSSFQLSVVAPEVPFNVVTSIPSSAHVKDSLTTSTSPLQLAHKTSSWTQVSTQTASIITQKSARNALPAAQNSTQVVSPQIQQSVQHTPAIFQQHMQSRTAQRHVVSSHQSLGSDIYTQPSVASQSSLNSGISSTPQTHGTRFTSPSNFVLQQCATTAHSITSPTVMPQTSSVSSPLPLAQQHLPSTGVSYDPQHSPQYSFSQGRCNYTQVVPCAQNTNSALQLQYSSAAGKDGGCKTQTEYVCRLCNIAYFDMGQYGAHLVKFHSELLTPLTDTLSKTPASQANQAMSYPAGQMARSQASAAYSTKPERLSNPSFPVSIQREAPVPTPYNQRPVVQDRSQIQLKNPATALYQQHTAEPVSSTIVTSAPMNAFWPRQDNTQARSAACNQNEPQTNESPKKRASRTPKTTPAAKEKKSHLKMMNAEKNFICEICGKAFLFKCNLRRHMQEHDTGVRALNVCVGSNNKLINGTAATTTLSSPDILTSTVSSSPSSSIVDTNAAPYACVTPMTMGNPSVSTYVAPQSTDNTATVSTVLLSTSTKAESSIPSLPTSKTARDLVQEYAVSLSCESEGESNIGAPEPKNTSETALLDNNKPKMTPHSSTKMASSDCTDKPAAQTCNNSIQTAEVPHDQLSAVSHNSNPALITYIGKPVVTSANSSSVPATSSNVTSTVSCRNTSAETTLYSKNNIAVTSNSDAAVPPKGSSQVISGSNEQAATMCNKETATESSSDCSTPATTSCGSKIQSATSLHKQVPTTETADIDTAAAKIFHSENNNYPTKVASDSHNQTSITTATKNSEKQLLPPPKCYSTHDM